jgi:hypothetical protein
MHNDDVKEWLRIADDEVNESDVSFSIDAVRKIRNMEKLLNIRNEINNETPAEQ